MYIKRETIDDLLRDVLERLIAETIWINPSRGKATELCGVLLELENPRARLSRSEGRGRFSSCLGELLWYLAGSNDVEFITYYVSQYIKESDDGKTVFGGYGPRLFRGDPNQVETVLKTLGKKDSRRAVIQLFSSKDIADKHKEVPCTCTMQFLLRRRKLHLLVNMRSQDAFIGLPHDIFAFTMLQEIFARTLKAEIGTYKHVVGSLHLYKTSRRDAVSYLNEGWQPTAAMPPMPKQDPWEPIRQVIRAEQRIRQGDNVNISRIKIAPYWLDLLRLLQIFRNRKDLPAIKLVKADMSTRFYDSYIEDLCHRL